MSKLVVNPNTPQAWEILLKPGTNSLGRSEANDFQINDPSVSGSHCHIVVGDAAVSLKDLGSTNGTFVGASRIQEHCLEHGKDFKLGGVEMIYYAALPQAASPAAPVARVSVRAAVPLAAVPAAAPMAVPQRPPPKSFYSKLPGAFGYPFRGAGLLILLCATIAFAALSFVAGGLFGIVVRVVLYGFIFLFMQNIILTTTSDEGEELAFPEASGLYGAAGQLFGTILASFWPAIGLSFAKLGGVDVPPAAIMGCVILGGIYFPMAFLAVAMKDTVLAANPLIVVPAMMKAPLEYAVTVILLLAVFGVRQLGDILSGGAGTLALRTHSQQTFLMAVGFKSLWAFLSMYLLTVTMRLLGLFYNGSKRKLGWFKTF